MKSLLVGLLLCSPAFGQMYTVAQDGCGAKNLGYCSVSVKSSDGVYQLVMDHRTASSGPIDTLTVTYVFPGTEIFKVHGTYSLEPCKVGKTCYGMASFVSDDGTVNAKLLTYEYYVASCAGRGCAGTQVGWHYKVLQGSTVVKQ